MNSDILFFLVHFSSVLAFLPISIMLWYLKKLKQRTSGWAILGYFSCLFLSGLLNYVSAPLFESIYPVFHATVLFKSYFVFLLFNDAYTNIKLKKFSFLFFIVILFCEIFEFISKGGFLANNNITFPVVNLVFILQFLLYLMDAFKNRPTKIQFQEGFFNVLSLTFFYSISQLFFALIREDIRFELSKNEYALLIWTLFVWFYIVYLLLSSYFLWRNFRS
jgi:hypothetical protein